MNLARIRRAVLARLRWLTPGIGVKRWLVVAAIGIALLLDAADRVMVADGIRLRVNEAIDAFVVDYFSPSDVAWIFAALGVVLVGWGIAGWTRSLLRLAAPGGRIPLSDRLRALRLYEGYKIVAIGGGTGLSTLLRGLKHHTANLTAIVTVSDDGGSSGRLQKELGVLPPGDIRNCLVALADDEALVTALFRYRFDEGDGLAGHSFGNLFLAAMTGITGNFEAAVKESSRVLNIVGRVLPATLAVVRLCARFADGTIAEGESRITAARKRIVELFFDPPHAEPLEEALQAIREADAIVLGPGSLYTSILPNFLVARMAEEVAASKAVKIYVCNVMTQPGETDDMRASDHVRALLENAGRGIADIAIVNTKPPERLLEAYASEGQVPVEADLYAVEALGVTPVAADVISETETVRHDPAKLAHTVIEIIARSVAERASLVRFARKSGG